MSKCKQYYLQSIGRCPHPHNPPPPNPAVTATTELVCMHFLLTPQHPQQSTTSSYLSLSSSCPGYPLHYHLHDIKNNLFQYYRCIDRTIGPFCSVDELPLRSQLAFCLFLNLSMSEHRVRTVRQIFALPVICKITYIRPT